MFTFDYIFAPYTMQVSFLIFFLYKNEFIKKEELFNVVG